MRHRGISFKVAALMLADIFTYMQGLLKVGRKMDLWILAGCDGNIDRSLPMEPHRRGAPGGSGDKKSKAEALQQQSIQRHWFKETRWLRFIYEGRIPRST